MADLVCHLKQSKHNLSCAKTLLNVANSRDWAITACFYAAIHFVEAGLIAVRGGTSRQLSPGRGTNAHSIRQNLVKSVFNDDCYLKYRHLREASMEVRYLDGTNCFITDHPAEEIYSQTQAKDFIEKDFEYLYKKIKTIAKTTNNLDLDF